MCGIFSYYVSNLKHIYELDLYSHQIYNNFDKLKNRGPDNTDYLKIDNITLGFHRLSINDVTSAGNQPMKYNDYYLICNGEIFNHLQIKYKYGFKTKSNSDCEIILHLYDLYLGFVDLYRMCVY